MFLKNDGKILAKINEDWSLDWVEKSGLDFDIKDFGDFLGHRVFSENRRDSRMLLARMGLVDYDVFDIAKRTRAFSLSDKLWIAYSENEEFETTFKAVFQELYNNKINQKGDSISSPCGQNEKRYIFNEDGSFGIAKKRLHPFSDDAKNEVLIYRLASKLGVKCCSAEMINEEAVFSKYEFDLNKNYLVPARYILEGKNIDCATFEDLVFGKLAKYQDDINRMILLDFLTLQDDRHLSNWAFIYNGETEIYPLFDNGRCLFYESDEQAARQVLAEPEAGATSCGLVGNYYDLIQIMKKHFDLEKLVDLDVNIDDCFDGLDYAPWKVQAIKDWWSWAVEEIKS